PLAGSDGSSAGGSSGPQSLGLITFADHPGEELSIGALKQLSERWAVKDGFTQEQRTEFGHLMSMVTSTYIPKNKLSRLREIDAGSFGKIYATTYDGCDVAVKQISNTAGSGIKAKMRELLLELRVLVRVRHPNVVTFWGTATEFPAENSDGEPYMGLVFELCPRDEPRWLTNEAAYLTPKTPQPVLSYGNILLAADLTPKIADFGCARVLSSTQMTLKTTTISGSPAYMAPEQIKGDDLSFAVDTWGMGVMLWEMMTNTKPWEGRFVDFNGLKKAIVNGERLHTPRGTPFPSSYVRSIALCMAMQADKRPGMAVVAAELKKAIK
ncbi:kinase-like domain-containing protein, partial [Baffinella frigidus]